MSLNYIKTEKALKGFFGYNKKSQGFYPWPGTRNSTF